MYVSFSRGSLSTRFQLILLVMVMGLCAAVGWFTYQSVHLANQNAQRLVSAYGGPGSRLSPPAAAGQTKK